MPSEPKPKQAPTIRSRHPERFPQEMLEFLAKPGGHSLVFRGVAGSGKTTLALQIIEEVAALQSSFYMSTRVSDLSLFAQFPWLADKVQEGEIYKARKVQVKKGEASPVEKILLGQHEEPGAPRPVRRVPRTALRQLEGTIATAEEETATTTPEGEIVMAVGTMLPEIEMAYDIVDRSLPDKTLVVIDSIDALAERYAIPQARLISSLQKDLVEGAGANVLYVLETPDPLLDYLGDGIVFLNVRNLENRRTRELEILKLRGVPIRQPRYLYTLQGGRVRTFAYESTAPIPNGGPFRPTSDPQDRVASTGIPDLDAMLGGGLRFASINLLELGRGASMFASTTIEHALIQNFALHKRGVAWMPTKKAGADAARAELTSSLGPGVFDAQVRVLEARMPSGAARKYAVALEGEDVGVDLKWQTLSYVLQQTAQPYAVVLGFDTLESIYGERALDGLKDFLGALLNAGGILLAVATPSVRSTSRLADLAQTHLRIEKVAGVTVMFGEEPYTGAYAFVHEPADGGVRVPRLIPIL